MTFRFGALAGAAVAVLAATAAAEAGAHGGHAVRRHALPPVSGTIALPRGAFGFGGRPDWREASGSRWRRPIIVYGVGRSRFDGDQRRAYSQLAGGGYAFSAPSHGWTGDGTGVIGILGNGGSLFAARGTGWGTADSATTGAGYDGWPAEPSVRATYGEPDLWTEASYGAPPRLGVYQSGGPITLPYYSSGSSAGPHGSPGGLAVYSSGAYGPGAGVILFGRRARGWRESCACGPRIIHLGQRRRRSADR